MVQHFMMCNSQDFSSKNLYLLTNVKILFKISKKHHYFRFLAEQSFFKLLLFLNGQSNKYQIGLKLKLIYNSFQKYKQGNVSSMVYHIRHEKNWCLDKNFDQKLIHSSQIDLKHQMSISTQAVPKTTSKFLPFGTNLVSFVQK